PQEWRDPAERHQPRLRPVARGQSRAPGHSLLRNAAVEWNEQASQWWKLWSDGQRAWLESLSRLPAGTVPSASGIDPVSAQRFRDAWTESVDHWMKAWTALSHDAVPLTSSPESLRKLLDPTAWAKPLPGSFDFGFERLIEGPTFASQPELQIKALKLQQ